MHETCGCLEIFADGCWMWFGRTEALLRHEPDLLGSLFAARGGAGFAPLFAERGLPADVNADFVAVLDELRTAGAAVVECSWARLEELRSIHWDEQASEVDPRIYKYAVSADGSEELVGIADSYPGVHIDAVARDEGTASLTQRGFVYRRRRLCRRDLWEHSDYETLLAVCDVLAVRYGADNVRWTVAFLD